MLAVGSSLSIPPLLFSLLHRGWRGQLSGALFYGVAYCDDVAASCRDRSGVSSSRWRKQPAAVAIVSGVNGGISAGIH